MLFQRREPAKWPEKLRISVWPRRSWGRSVKYVTKRVLRITATPHAIAAGVAAGVFTSFTPFMGFHFIIAATLAYIIGGNLIASALGTFFGNPLTFPVIWISTYTSGNYILHGKADMAASAGHASDPISALSSLAEINLFHSGFSGLKQAVSEIWDPILLPMAVGGIPLGIAFGILFYVLTLKAAKWFRHTRAKVIAAKAAIRAEESQLAEGLEDLNEKVEGEVADISGKKQHSSLGQATRRARDKAVELKERGRERIADKYAGSFAANPKTY